MPIMRMRRPGGRSSTIALALTLGVALGLAAVLVRGTTRTPAAQPALYPMRAQVTWGRGTKRAPAFSLRDQNDRPTSVAALRGHPVLLTFLDSVCRSECPLEGRALADVQRRIAGSGAVLAVVSVDPWADTPETARAFARKSHWDSGWRWLFGSVRSLRPVWAAYSIGVQRRRGDVAHSTALYLIDGRGYLRAAYLFPFASSAVAHDVRAVASESPA